MGKIESPNPLQKLMLNHLAAKGYEISVEDFNAIGANPGVKTRDLPPRLRKVARLLWKEAVFDLDFQKLVLKHLPGELD